MVVEVVLAMGLAVTRVDASSMRQVMVECGQHATDVLTNVKDKDVFEAAVSLPLF